MNSWHATEDGRGEGIQPGGQDRRGYVLCAGQVPQDGDHYSEEKTDGVECYQLKENYSNGERVSTNPHKAPMKL